MDLRVTVLQPHGDQAETEPAEPPPSFEEVLAQRQPPELPPATPDNTLTLLISSLFWAVLVFVLISALLFFLRERGVTFNRGALRRAWQLWVAWLRTLWQGFETQVVELRQSLRLPRRAREEAEETAVSPWRFVRVNALSPREQIRYFYLSVVRRAGDKGVMRGPSETPLEYIQDLTSEWPEEADDISQLTDAFLEARYAARPIEKTRADAVKGTWKQVKASIRGRRREEDES